MKKILKLSLATLLIASVGVLSLFAFTPKHQLTAAKESKKFTPVFYQYGGAQPTTSTSLNDAASWTPVSPNPCPLSGHTLCAISFDDSDPNFTITQAKALVPVLSSYTNGSTFSDGIGHTITIYTKS